MTKIVQVEGGSNAVESLKTRPSRVITADTDNHDLLLHDGVTPGGHRIQSQDNADQRYQAKNTELNGLTGFSAEQRGFLVRLGPSDYRLRKLTVNDQQLIVIQDDGYLGNPEIGLAPTITTQHTFTNQQIFQDVVEFQTGINADVSGNLEGDVVGNVTGNLTGNVTGNAQGNHTGSFW
jgi:hypothetical protein